MGKEEVYNDHFAGKHIHIHGIAKLVHHAEVLYAMPKGIGLFFASHGIGIHHIVEVFAGHVHMIISVFPDNEITG